jgi:cytochrome c-type biogenesis protein CcmH/NrfG
VFYNTGDVNGAVTACRQSVQADPSRPDAWFVLGSALFADAKIDATGKVAITAETRQALEKYLELAPDGPHAADVKSMLQMAK